MPSVYFWAYIAATSGSRANVILSAFSSTGHGTSRPGGVNEQMPGSKVVRPAYMVRYNSEVKYLRYHLVAKNVTTIHINTMNKYHVLSVFTVHTLYQMT